jgi:glucan 1,3-beta-glucosidase
MFPRHPYAATNTYSLDHLPETYSAMSGTQYDPLPLTTDHHDDVRYSDRPTSPGDHLARLQNPEIEPLGADDDDLGAASMRPRFLGRALQDEGPGPRSSYASSGNSVPIGDDAQSSVYGLNPGPTRDTAYYSLNYRDDPHDTDFARSTPDISGFNKPSSPYLSEKRAAYAAPRARSRKRALIIGGLVLAAVVIIAVVVAVYFAAIKPRHNGSGAASGGTAHDGSSGSNTDTSASPSASSTPVALVVTGGDGSKVTKDDGSTFTYQNPYGGYWYWDPTDPLNNGARAQSWTPALNETFQYGVNPIRG